MERTSIIHAVIDARNVHEVAKKGSMLQSSAIREVDESLIKPPLLEILYLKIRLNIS